MREAVCLYMLGGYFVWLMIVDDLMQLKFTVKKEGFMSCSRVLGPILILLPLLKVILLKCLLMWIANKRFQIWALHIYG